MAEENPISPISDAQPPKVNPIKPAVGSTLKLNPVVRKPVVGGATSALKPGLKLPPKTGATVSTLRPGLKLPPKPGTATQAALKPGLKLPPRPQIRKPGETSVAAPIPKPVIPAAAPAPAAEGWKCGCGNVATGKFCTECGAKKPEATGWQCACGSVNKGKFCPECGAKKPAAAPLYRCDKCGWEPEDPKNPPRFCPECGDRFDDNDIR